LQEISIEKEEILNKNNEMVEKLKDLIAENKNLILEKENLERAIELEQEKTTKIVLPNAKPTKSNRETMISHRETFVPTTTITQPAKSNDKYRSNSEKEKEKIIY